MHRESCRNQKFVAIRRSISSIDSPFSLSWNWIGTCIVAVEIQTIACAATAAQTAQTGIAGGRDQNIRIVNTVPRSAGATRNVRTRGEVK